MASFCKIQVDVSIQGIDWAVFEKYRSCLIQGSEWTVFENTGRV